LKHEWQSRQMDVLMRAGWVRAICCFWPIRARWCEQTTRAEPICPAAANQPDGRQQPAQARLPPAYRVTLQTIMNT